MDKLETAVEQMKRARQQEYEKHKQMAMEYERQMAMSQINYPKNPTNNLINPTPYIPVRQSPTPQTVYSIAEVQLTGGRMIGMTISAAPTIGKHLIETMKNTGYLHIFNDSESLMIRSEEIVAVKITKLTTE
jgi:hypothetical protein